MIPSGATITAASMTLTMQNNCSACDHTHEVRKATSDWEQNTFSGTGTGPTAGALTTTFEAPTSAGATVTITGLAADVQGFLDSASSNRGWRLNQIQNTGASAAGPFRWSTLEASTAANRPRLVIEYSP